VRTGRQSPTSTDEPDGWAGVVQLLVAAR
jgi:hypothetical protein